MAKRIMFVFRRKIKSCILLALRFLFRTKLPYFFLLLIVKKLQSCPITDTERHPKILKYYERLVSISRTEINQQPETKRELFALTYIIPSICILFDKNYVNFAQISLFIVEEYFLSISTEEEFEKSLTLFSQHAINAGLRFREKFPLQSYPSTDHVGFLAPRLAISGWEVVLGLGKFLKHYTPSVIAQQVFDTRGDASTREVFSFCGYKLVMTPKSTYDVFSLRKSAQEDQLSIALWAYPPFHMFFLFAFGFAPKQIWFSQYLRPNIQFPYLDDTMTPGGAGTLFKKNYNGKDWNIIPQVSHIEHITYTLPKKLFLFVPARLEKLKQPVFLDCVAKILKSNPFCTFQWTGYHFDKEVHDFFDKQGLKDQNIYIPWMSNKNLLKVIATSDLILACFPLSLGTVEAMAAYYRRPVMSLYDEKCNHYWRDIYWEAINGNEELQEICLNADGSSKIRIVRTPEEYVEQSLVLLRDAKLRKEYGGIYHDAYTYTYLNNPNDLTPFFDKMFIREQ